MGNSKAQPINLHERGPQVRHNRVLVLPQAFWSVGQF
jgi:hypothetical protein